MASCAGPIGAASPPARYILSGICRASGRGCRSEAARVFSWVAMPPAVSAFVVVACCFSPVGAASLVDLLQVLLWFRPSFGFVFDRLRRVSCSRCIYTCYHLKCLCGPSARLYGYSWRVVRSWLASWCLARFLALFRWSVLGVGRVFGFLRRLRCGAVHLCRQVLKMPIRGYLGPYLAVYGRRSSSALQVCAVVGLASFWSSDRQRVGLVSASGPLCDLFGGPWLRSGSFRRAVFLGRFVRISSGVVQDPQRAAVCRLSEFLPAAGSRCFPWLCGGVDGGRRFERRMLKKHQIRFYKFDEHSGGRSNFARTFFKSADARYLEYFLSEF